MKNSMNLIVGNGINIQFGGIDNTNKSIILRAMKFCKSPDFPAHIIIDNPNLLLDLFGKLYIFGLDLIHEKKVDYFISPSEEEKLNNFLMRYDNNHLRIFDIGFEDYLLLYDLNARKLKLQNPDKYFARETLKSFFIHSIYNKGKVEKIYLNFPPELINYFNKFENIFTTNYDNNIEMFSNKKINYLHGSFHIRADVYSVESLRNKLSDSRINEIKIDEDFEYLYSNILSDHDGYSKLFSMNATYNANDAITKFVTGYKNNKQIRNDINSWNRSTNDTVRKLYESIMIKLDDENNSFTENYPIDEFNGINGSVSIIGLSPNNDSHLFDKLNMNNQIDDVKYYFYSDNEITPVKQLLPNINISFENVNNVWKGYS